MKRENDVMFFRDEEKTSRMVSILLQEIQNNFGGLVACIKDKYPKCFYSEMNLAI